MPSGEVRGATAARRAHGRREGRAMTTHRRLTYCDFRTLAEGRRRQRNEDVSLLRLRAEESSPLVRDLLNSLADEIVARAEKAGA